MAHDLLRPAPPGLDASPFGPPFPLVLADGEFADEADTRVSVHASALSYGTGTFDGMRAFWNPGHQELYLLDARAHYERLHRSAAVLGLPLRWPAGELVELTAELLRRNQVTADAYVRPILFQSGPVLPVRMHDVTTRLTVAVTPVAGHYASPQGLRCTVSSWRRAPDVTTPVRAKVIGSYVGPALAKTEAVRAGHDEALLLTCDGFVAEATTSNVLVRAGQDWATPPATDDILPGLTRHRVMELIGETTGREVRERRVHRSELLCCDELLLCGTATTVAPVVEVDGHRVGDGRPGALTVALRDTIHAIARRDDPRHQDWTTPVYGKDSRP
jgi:branched-chain amino acid aminotransferase